MYELPCFSVDAQFKRRLRTLDLRTIEALTPVASAL